MAQKEVTATPTTNHFLVWPCFYAEESCGM